LQLDRTIDNTITRIFPSTVVSNMRWFVCSDGCDANELNVPMKGNAMRMKPAQLSLHAAAIIGGTLCLALSAHAAGSAGNSKGVNSPRPADPQAISKRCSVHKVDEDRVLCEQRMSTGEQSGSVESGGILRTHSFTEPQPSAPGSVAPKAQ
jgi:hypothetical protein